MSTLVSTRDEPAEHQRSSPRPSADGSLPSSAEEQLLSMAMLMPDTWATLESISRLSDSAEKDEQTKQPCGFIQRRLVLAQVSAAQPPSLPTASVVQVKARRGGGIGPGEEDQQR